MIGRGLLALSVSLVALSALAPVASADNDVLLVVNGASPIRIDGERLLDNDIGGDQAEFTIRNVTGEVAAEGASVPGVSIPKLLLFQGLSASNLVDSPDAVEVEWRNQSVALSKAEVTGGFDGDPRGHRDAVIGIGYGSVRFVRPLRSDADTNGGDRIDVPKGDDLTVRIATTGPPLHVDASATPMKIEQGGSVQFHAQVQEHEPGVTYTYTWDFDDGSPQVSDPNPQHTYTRDGTAQPRVTVVGLQDGSAGSRSVGTIQIGEPAAATPTATATASATATAESNTTGGAGPPGGGEGNKKDRATGPVRSKGKDNTRKRGSKGGKATATPTATAAATATATATAAATATATPPPTSNDPAASPGSPEAIEEPALAPETGAPAQQGERVEGILLASAGSLADVIDAAKSAEKQQEQDRSQARRGGGGGASVAGWVGGSAGLLALLALGALREGGFSRRGAPW